MAGDNRFEAQRGLMVKEQLEDRGIQDKRVLRVFKSLPREKFVIPKYQNQAYGDYPLEIGRGQTISQPYIVALMTEFLNLRGKEKVLEIGTGSGYQTAVLGKLAKKVYSMERDAVLAKRAKKLLKKLGFDNIEVIIEDGFLGFSQAAPYQAIILTAAPTRIPLVLIRQLAQGGRLVAPEGEGPVQRLIRIKKNGKKIEKEDFGACAFVPLVSGVEK